jgi:hypothetical protein
MKIVPQPERLDARVPLGILAVSLLTLLISSVLTVGVRALTEYDLHRAGNGSRPLVPAEAAAAQPSGLFERHGAPAATRQLPDRLRQYGWVQREQGLVHIPLERAKQLYLALESGATPPVSQRQAPNQPEPSSPGAALKQSEAGSKQ